MYERIAMLEGALTFESEPGDTMVRIEVPLK
jgi:signal transduction histidine kinase